MNVSQIATFYESAALSLEKSKEALQALPPMVRPEDCSHLAVIQQSALIMLEQAQLLFVKDFPRSFSSFIKNPDAQISVFYNLIAKYPQILKNCEDLFCDFVKAHVESNVSGHSAMYMFNWNWDAIYTILSSNYMLDFVKNTKSKNYYSMVLALAKHLDVIKDTNCERAVLFFSASAGLVNIYPDIKVKIIKLLTINPNQGSWVTAVMNHLQ